MALTHDEIKTEATADLYGTAVSISKAFKFGEFIAMQFLATAEKRLPTEPLPISIKETCDGDVITLVAADVCRLRKDSEYLETFATMAAGAEEVMIFSYA